MNSNDKLLIEATNSVPNFDPLNAEHIEIILAKFAEIVRQDEREACAEICDDKHHYWHFDDVSGPKECADAIRAREKP